MFKNPFLFFETFELAKKCPNWVRGQIELLDLGAAFFDSILGLCKINCLFISKMKIPQIRNYITLKVLST